MTSFFYVLCTAFHTSVPVLQKCMDTSIKKLFLLRVQPLLHLLLHLFVGPGRLASHRLFEMSKDLKVTGGRSGEYVGCGKHSKDRSWIVATVEWAVWGRALPCWSKTPVLNTSTWFGLDCRTQVILQEICICCIGHSVPPEHVVLQNYPSFIPKESQHNLSHR
jgi:hypothetical protein